MRNYLHIDLDDRTVKTEELHGEAIVRAGRYFIAKTLLAGGIARIEPLSPENPLIFSAGPFAGTHFSNANRLSVGCKSPMTGGIKEANAGGTFAFALGQLETAGFTLYGASKEWVVIHITRERTITYDSAEPYMGKGNIEAAALLFEKYGKEISIALCGPVGEYGGLMAGIAITDVEGRPSRLAARGGVGAVMGSKKVKAIVVDMDKMPSFHERNKVMGALREYASRLRKEPAVDTFKRLGTAMMGDITNYVGALPVRNFRAGRLVETSAGPLKLGGDYVRELNVGRGGDPSHACMRGCMIKCGNVYVDPDGKELVAPLEYETLGLMGSNCGLEHPDDVARVNAVANDLGIDTIEAGATLGVLMEAGLGDFGDVNFMLRALDSIRQGNEQGRIFAQGAARAGAHYEVTRIPVIKKQSISAYDPRVIEVTGMSMMVSAQGADHTAGNLPGFDCKDKSTAEIVAASLEAQASCATADSLGLCIFARAVTNASAELIVNALNDAHGTRLDASFMRTLGMEALKMEWEFNRQAGFTEKDDELPEFFYAENLPPSNKRARHHSAEVNRSLRELLATT